MILLFVMLSGLLQQATNQPDCAREMPSSLMTPYTRLVSSLGVSKMTRQRATLRFGVGPQQWNPSRASPVRVCLAVFTPEGIRVLTENSKGEDEHFGLPNLKPGKYRFWAESRGYFPLQGYVTISRFHGVRDVCVQMVPLAATDTVSSWMLRCP